MGNKVSRSYRAFRARKLRRFILVGLDNSGKTTLKEHMLGLNKEGTVPTMEAEHFQVKFGGYTFLVTVRIASCLWWESLSELFL